MREIPEPTKKTWILVVHGQYKGCAGWLSNRKSRWSRKADGWKKLPELEPGCRYVVVKVTKQSITGEYVTFNVTTAMPEHHFVMAQLEFNFAA